MICHILTILRVKRTEEENMGRYSMSVTAFEDEKDLYSAINLFKEDKASTVTTTCYHSEWNIEAKWDTMYLYVGVVVRNTDIEGTKCLDIISADTDIDVVEKKLAEFQAANKDDVFMTARLKGLLIK